MKRDCKNIVVVLLCVILAAISVGCGKPENGNVESSRAESGSGGGSAASGQDENGEEGNGQQIHMDGMKIAIVSSPSGVDDNGFNKNIYDGILAFIADNPESSITPVKEPSGDVASAVQAVADIVADYDVIVCCGFQFAGIAELAEENPEVSFILVDSYPVDASGNEVVVDNIYAMLFKEQESGFCVGVAAALESKSGKVAVVNGVAYPSNVNYQYGFMSGVAYANEQYGTSAEIVELPSYAGIDSTGTPVGGNYVGSFSDEATGKVLGQALIDQGCDVIFVVAGASGNGVFTAAKEAGNVFCIGGDVDQFDDGVSGSSNIILTSSLKIMDKNVEAQLHKIKNGTFQSENALLGADTDSTGYVKARGRHQLSEDTIAKMDEAFAKVKNGEVVPATAIPED